MSFINSNAFYQEELLLLDKNIEAPTTITEGQVINGDLAPFRHRIESVNTGNQKQNNGILILRIPPDGTFVRKEPILVDESAKDDYIIQFKIKQDLDKDGVYETEGRLWRFIVGQPTLQDDEHVGETLKLNLISLEYKTKETPDSERLERGDSERTVFVSPKDAFVRRAIAYNEIKGVDNPQLLFTSTGVNPTIKLPDDDALKQEWRPFAPVPTHDLFREVIDRQSLPGVSGGAFTDFFFDYEPHPLSTKTLNLKSEAVGTVDRGIIIDPLLFTPADSEKDKTINVDLISFKNNVILEGSPRGGSLPVDKSRFASQYEHGRFRPDWDATTTYFTGTATGTSLSKVKIVDSVLGLRFFKALFENTNNNPLTPGQTAWYEDFVTIPSFDPFAEYQEGQIVTSVVDVGFYSFWKANKLITKGGFGPSPSSLDWDQLSPEIPTNQREAFFSYTPWTANFEAMRASLFGVRSDSATATDLSNIGYSAVVPDMNYVRANFDRVNANSRFEQVTFKDVIKRVTSSNEITVGERHLGARFLVNSTGTQLFAGQHNKIAEWIGEDFPSGSMTIDDWAFSNYPIDGDMVIDQDTTKILTFNLTSNVWETQWDVITNQIVIGTKAHGDAQFSSPLHICKDLNLVEGASGIPGQAFELTYDWLTNIFTGEGDRNLNSRGAWFFMQFPLPKIETFGRDIGDLYKNPVLDTNNLNLNSKGQNGWNRGLDSEDLGRIQRLNMKLRLSLFATNLFGTPTTLAIGYADMPMKAFAVDIFDRVWFTDFKLRRNGEYSTIKLAFGETAPQQLHHYRVDELLQLFGIILPFDFFLKQKEWTGIEFDWRFVKSWGVFYAGGYGVNNQYIAGQFLDYISSVLAQVASQLAHHAITTLTFTEIPLENSIIKHAKLAVDELHFEKQMYVNSDDFPVDDARSVLDHLVTETDYLNAKTRAIGSRERKKFVNQAWFMKAHGDVRARFGEKFTASGDRVPGGTQDLIFNEVKHIIDSDGYFLEFTGVRKFVFT